MDLQTVKDGKIPFEEALTKTGYGVYSYLMIALAGVSTISFVALMYGSTIIVPTSACELDTTNAQQGLLVGVPVAASLSKFFLAGVSTIHFVALMYGSTIIVPTNACKLDTSNTQQVLAGRSACCRSDGVLWGYLGDTRGRRRMLLMSLVLGAASNALASISVNWVMLMLIQLCTVTLGSGIYVLSMTLLSESVPLQKRNVAMLLVSSVFLLGQGVISVMAIPIIPLSFSFYMPALGIFWNSWRTLQAVYSVPSLLCAIWLLFMQESPKYALACGKEEWALRILGTIHRTNNGKRSEKLQVKGLLQETDSKEKKSGVKDQVVPLFKKPYLKYTLIMACLFILFQILVAFLVWAPTIANQLMQLLETGEGSDLTLCQILATDIPADADATPCSINSVAMLLLMAMCGLHSVFNTVLSQVVDKAGRRNMAMVIVTVSGVAGVLINLVPSAVGAAVLFVVFSLAVVVMGVYTAIAVALFPTHLRTMAVATTMMGARVASVLFIQIVNYLLANSCELGFYLFSVLFASSALVLALLPDDRRLRAPKQPERTDQHEMRTSL